MATMILLPNGQHTVSSDWATYGETYPWQCLDDENGNTSTMTCNDHGEFMIIEFASPSVAEADIDRITSVRYSSSGRADHRTSAALATISYEAPSGNAAQINSYDSSPSSFEKLYGTARLYSDGLGGTDWTYSDLEDLEMRVTKLLPVPVVLTYLAMEVTYTTVAVDNATFFGANF